jgi:hypothetical protein
MEEEEEERKDYHRSEEVGGVYSRIRTSVD